MYMRTVYICRGFVITFFFSCFFLSRCIPVCLSSCPFVCAAAICYSQQQMRYNFFAFLVTPTLPAPSGVVASARLCCLSRVPPAVCPSMLESATTAVCNSFLQSLSTYVRTPTPHSILRFRPAPQTPDLHTSNLPLV